MLSGTDYTIYTLSIFDRVTVMVTVRFNVQIKYSNSMIFKNSLSASLLVRGALSDNAMLQYMN